MVFNPRMLIIARESRRLTQKALADASSTTQASISRAEAGVHEPQDSMIDAWAHALRYPSTFFAHTSDAPPLPRTFWRKQSKLGRTDQKEIEATIAIRCLNLQALVRSVDLPEPDAPTITLGTSVRSPVEAAQYLRARWHVPVGPVADLVGLVEGNGIFVVRLPGTEGFQGVSIRDPRKDLPPVMFVSADDPADRERWTVAHELGHIVLHHHIATVGDDEDEIEDEANAFAAEFLMPAHEIRHQLSSRTGLADLAQLKLHWRVSMGALLRRGHTLEKISPGQYTRLWREMAHAGYKRVEPNAFEHEQPGLLQELARVHLEDLGFTEDEFAALLSLVSEDVKRVYFDSALLESTLELVTPEPTSQPRLRLVE